MRSGDLRLALAEFLGGRPRRPKLVLFRTDGTSDVGDEAVLRGIVSSCRPHADVTYVSRTRRIAAGERNSFAMTLNAIRAAIALVRCDVVAIGGAGNFANDAKLSTQLLPVLAWVVRRLGKETAFVAVGVCPTAPGWVQAALRTVAANSALVTARDEESAAVLGPRAIVVDDPAVALEPAPGFRGRFALGDVGIACDVMTLGISMKPTPYVAYNQYQVDVFATVSDWWHEHIGGETALLCLSGVGDEGSPATDVTLARDVRERAMHRDHVHILGPAIEPEVMKSAIGEMTAVVGHRREAHLFASSMQIPFADASAVDGGDITRWLERVAHRHPATE
jgi:polysaccharide pyruvyl transferase WcaK-like protein